MSSPSIFSSPDQLKQLSKLICKYVRLPFSPDNIPGSLMEAALAYIRKGKVLRTYDFVDVVEPDLACGWQVKSTKDTTPVTWKRAKIPNAQILIQESWNSAVGLQALGDAIITYCNEHAVASLNTYSLDTIVYSRLIVHSNQQATYFERILCTREHPNIFEPSNFEWYWSTQKNVSKKEQLRALHGINKQTGNKWFAWHGLGENQLHFSGEKAWWPQIGDSHSTTFDLPTEAEKIDLDKFMELLSDVGE